MKVFCCVIAGFIAGVLALPAPSNKMEEIKMINPKILANMQQFKNIADNFESWSPRKQIQDINDFVDVIIMEVCAFIKSYHFDPMDLPKLDEDFEISGHHIQLNLTNGVLSNMSSIYRSGDVELTYVDRSLVVKVPIFFKIFQMDYNYDLKVDQNEILKGVMHGEVVLVDVIFAVKLDFKELHIGLKSFDIPTMGAIKIKFDGGMASDILEALTNFVTVKFEGSIQTIARVVCLLVLNAVFDLINEVLDTLKP